MFNDLIVQPIFNVLVLIYSLLPGHNFGLAIIIFTVVVRLAMWPLVKKQLHQVKVMRKLQPEIKEIQKKYKRDRQKMQLMLMELYKERGVNPLGSLGVLIPQFIILIGLYSGLVKVVKDPQQIVSFAYPFLQDFSWMKQLGENIHLFDETLFGLVDLTRAASANGSIYWPAMIIVILSSVVQYYQSKQVMPNDKNARKLRDILKAAGRGEEADQSEVQAATSRTMLFILPIIIFVVTIGLPAALGLYWLIGSLVAIVQQAIILREDEEEMEALGSKGDKNKRNLKDIPEAEIVTEKVATASKAKSKKSSSSKSAKKKRRKK